MRREQPSREPGVDYGPRSITAAAAEAIAQNDWAFALVLIRRAELGRAQLESAPPPDAAINDAIAKILTSDNASLLRAAGLEHEVLTLITALRGTPSPVGDDPRLTIAIEDLDLSVRAENVLLNAKIMTLGDLTSRSMLDLLKLPHCGRRTLREYQAVLDKYGLALRIGKQKQPAPTTPIGVSVERALTHGYLANVVQSIRVILLNYDQHEQGEKFNELVASIQRSG